MVCQCKSALKFGGITSGFLWYTSGISVVYQWKSVAKFGGITSGIPVFSSEISVVLPVVSS